MDQLNTVDGWIEEQLQLTSGTESFTPLTVPQCHSVNVIEEVIESPDQMGEDSADFLGEISEVKQESATALDDLVQRAGVERLRELRSGRNNVAVSRGQTPCQGCLSNNILMNVRKKLIQDGLTPQWKL